MSDTTTVLGYRVYGNWGSAEFGHNWNLVGLTTDRTGYLALCERAYRDGANETWIDRVEAVDGQETTTRIFAE